ncbi:MAG: 30S ribosomal protein S20 [Planctomycetaceae bacterium]|nr:30S ribosomal protein S20 [Planctomycetaceae bacterium]
MPNTESAKRALRKAERRQIRNKSERTALKTTVKKVRVAAAASDVASGKTLLQTAIKKLDQAADKHLIHANKAARLKSRLTKMMNKVAAAPAAAAAPAN